MTTKFFAFIFASVLANTAMASWVAPVEKGACTRDFNPWGQSANCACPHATAYDNRIGQCVQGAPVNVILEGALAAEENVAEETSSIVLANNSRVPYQLIMTRALKAELSELNLEGKTYRIIGEILEIEEDASVNQPTVIVDRVEVIEENPSIDIETSAVAL